MAKKNVERVCLNPRCGTNFLARRADVNRGVAIFCSNSCSASARTKTKYSPRYIEEDRGFRTPCWIWQLSKNTKGYGFENDNGTMSSPHRVMYSRVFGPIPPGMHIDHLCSVRDCCNPDHLEAVTPATNVRRSRAASRLTMEAAKSVREMFARGVNRNIIAERYKITPTYVNCVVRGDIWK